MRITKKQQFNAALILVPLLLTGCKGGGGGDDQPVASTPAANNTSTQANPEPVQPTAEEKPIIPTPDPVVVPDPIVVETPVVSKPEPSKPPKLEINILKEDDDPLQPINAASYSLVQPFKDREVWVQRMNGLTWDSDRLYILTDGYTYSRSVDGGYVNTEPSDTMGVHIVDPSNQKTLGSLHITPDVKGFYVDKDLLYTTDYHRLHFYNVADAANPLDLGEIATDERASFASGSDHTLYFNTRNGLNARGVDENGQSIVVEQATLNSLAMGRVVALASKADTLYVHEQHLTPGITATYKGAWSFPQSVYDKTQSIPAAAAGALSDEQKAPFADLGSDVLEQPYTKDNIRFAFLLNSDAEYFSMITDIYSNTYLEAAQVDSIQVFDLAEKKPLAVLTSKTGERINTLRVQGNSLTVSIMDDLNRNKVDTVEWYDLQDPQHPQLMGRFDKPSYPTLVSDFTVFGDNHLAYSISASSDYRDSRQNFRIYDATDPSLVQVLYEAKLPKDMLANQLIIQGQQAFITTEGQTLVVIDLPAIEPTSQTAK